MSAYLALSLLVLLYSLTCTAINGTFMKNCQNGGNFDKDLYECICTPNYYGRQCETAFSLFDPCANWSSVQVLRDEHAVHRLGNNKPCGELPDKPCVDFSVIYAGWYRLVSPAGGELIIGTPTGNVACGSTISYFILNQTVQQEDNANRMLFRARAYPYRHFINGGFFPEDTSYPVRILKCFSALTLYYLEPLPSRYRHYCIGNKQPCAVGLNSVDGTGFEPCIGAECLPQLMKNVPSPQLRLDYEVQKNGIYSSSFRCNVFAAFHVNASEANGVLYQVEYELTLRNGTSIDIPQCRWQDVSIQDGENRTFECSSEFMLTSQINVYGGSLICRAWARCNSTGTWYESMPVVSNVHGFFFRHWFQGRSNVIKPDTPATLCIDSKNIPVLEEVTFFISVGRPKIMLGRRSWQKIMVTDRINVSVVRRDGNESLSCVFKMVNNSYKEEKLCQDMVPYNYNPDIQIPLRLTQGDQMSVIKVNISFSSSANGIFTRHGNGSSFSQKFQSIEMKVDLSRLQSEVTTYLDMYCNTCKCADNCVQPTKQANVCPPAVKNLGSQVRTTWQKTLKSLALLVFVLMSFS